MTLHEETMRFYEQKARDRQAVLIEKILSAKNWDEFLLLKGKHAAMKDLLTWSRPAEPTQADG